MPDNKNDSQKGESKNLDIEHNPYLIKFSLNESIIQEKSRESFLAKLKNFFKGIGEAISNFKDDINRAIFSNKPKRSEYFPMQGLNDTSKGQPVELGRNYHNQDSPKVKEYAAKQAKLAEWVKEKQSTQSNDQSQTVITPDAVRTAVKKCKMQLRKLMMMKQKISDSSREMKRIININPV